jgi:hypothetical protein
MITPTHYIIPKRILYLTLAIVALAVFGVSVVLAQTLVQPDGRINQVAHFGGDALYCVDRNMNPTTQYSDWGEGGFQLLSMTGQVLWFVPAEQIAAAVAEAKATGGGVLVGTGDGSYGPTSIYTYLTADGDDYFVFNGYDEYGKPNSIEWKFCTPVSPGAPEPSADTACFVTGIYDDTIACDDIVTYCEANEVAYETVGNCLCEFGIGDQCLD